MDTITWTCGKCGQSITERKKAISDGWFPDWEEDERIVRFHLSLKILDHECIMEDNICACPHCGGPTQIEKYVINVRCKYCGTISNIIDFLTSKGKTRIK